MGDAELLARCELFAGLDAPAMATLAATVRSVSLRRNQLLFAEGEAAGELFVVRRGRVAVAKRGAGGRQSVVALLGAGDVVGEMGLFDGAGRSADARAIDTAEVVAVPYTAARQVLMAHPASLWALVTLLGRRLRATDETLADTVFLDVPARTAKRLLEVAGDGGAFSAALTQEELASMVGASRERVNKAINTFVRLGWVEQSGRRYRVVDPARLAACAE